MKDYTTYGPQDLLQDESFVQWLKLNRPTDGEHGVFWTKWYQDHPSKQKTIEKAEVIYRVIAERPDSATVAKAKSEIWNAIEKSISQESQNIRTISPKKNKKVFRLRVWSIAASVAVLVALGALFGPWSKKTAVTEDLVFVDNATQNPMTVTMSDGSSIKLFPNATLSYPSAFTSTDRSVFIDGKAFFEVAKDKQHPFIVSSEHFTVKVLGTSFIVNDGEDTENIDISVIKGRVEVFGKTGDDDTEEVSTKGTILVENDMLSYDETSELFEKTEYQGDLAEAFVFRNTPVKQVLDRLQSFYGINVIVDQDKLTECHFNASLMDIPLPEKISLLCSAIGYEYTFEENTLTLVGEGCD